MTKPKFKIGDVIRSIGAEDLICQIIKIKKNYYEYDIMWLNRKGVEENEVVEGVYSSTMDRLFTLDTNYLVNKQFNVDLKELLK